MREWLSGGVSPCQGEGRGFESRLALPIKKWYPREGYHFFVCDEGFEVRSLRSTTVGAKRRSTGSPAPSRASYKKVVSKRWISLFSCAMEDSKFEVSVSLRSVQSGGPQDLLHRLALPIRKWYPKEGYHFFRVRWRIRSSKSSFHYGRCKAEVHRTSCIVSRLRMKA